ncbi:MAG: Hsp20/alpha crystallin family protein [Candidatus Heimdallarchaeota archaeon]
MNETTHVSEFDKPYDHQNYDKHRMNRKRHARFIREFFHHTMMNQHGSRVHSRIEKDNLIIQLILPGVEKSSIKIKAKRNKVEVNAERKSDVFLFQHKEAHKILDLENDVQPDNANAEYSDGILTIKFPLVNSEEDNVEGVLGD